MRTRIGLGITPTPLQAAPRLGSALDLDLYVKRDDLIGFGVAGTKTRAIEQLVADAIDQGCDRIIGCGGPTSNFCAGLAAAGAVAGVRVELVLYATPTAARAWPAHAARQAGASIRFVEVARQHIEEAAADVGRQLAEGGARPYVVPRGGSTAVGASGAANGVLELGRQLSAPPAHLVVAGGSAGTAAGLLAGIAALGWPTVLTVAAVSRTVEETTAKIAALAPEVATRLGLPEPHLAQLEVRDARGPGFGHRDPSADAMADLALETEGIILDPVYTAKAATVLRHLAAAGAPVVFWHTGGLAAALNACAPDHKETP